MLESIEEAIEHCKQKMTDCTTECSYEHKQLCEWLEKLKEYESLPKIHGWVARDEDKTLNVFLDDYCPDRGVYVWLGETKIRLERKGTKTFPEITWESEPVEVELLIRRI